MRTIEIVGGTEKDGIFEWIIFSVGDTDFLLLTIHQFYPQITVKQVPVHLIH